MRIKKTRKIFIKNLSVKVQKPNVWDFLNFERMVGCERQLFKEKQYKKIVVLDMFYDPKIGLLWHAWGFFYCFRFIFMFTNIENKLEMLNK